MEAIVQAKTASTEFDANRDALDLTRDLPVTSDEEKEFAAEGLRWVKEQHAELEERRTAITKPLNAALREINNLFRPMKTALEDAERVLKKRIAGYLEQKQIDNVRAIEAAASAATAAQAETALARVESVEAPQGVSIRYRWVFTIDDADLIPREYLEPSMVKIGRAVQESDGKVQIPGISVRQEPIVTSRRV
jgi:hypothetical protein